MTSTPRVMTPQAVQEAMQRLMEGVPVAQNEGFPPEVNARLATVQETAERNARRVDPKRDQAVVRLLDVAVKAPTATKRVLWLNKAADAFAQATAPHAACSDGCSHCCYIPVKISKLEARALGRSIGREIVEPSLHQEVDIGGYRSPCTFLVDGRCSIYDSRPAVCRTHFNMDDDELLCRLADDAAIPVPYADSRLLAITSSLLDQDPANWADIRQWFPPSNG